MHFQWQCPVASIVLRAMRGPKIQMWGFNCSCALRAPNLVSLHTYKPYQNKPQDLSHHIKKSIKHRTHTLKQYMHTIHTHITKNILHENSHSYLTYLPASYLPACLPTHPPTYLPSLPTYPPTHLLPTDYLNMETCKHANNQTCKHACMYAYFHTFIHSYIHTCMIDR